MILDPPAVTREPDATFEAGSQPVDLVAVDLDGIADGNELNDLVAVDLASGVLTVESTMADRSGNRSSPSIWTRDPFMVWPPVT